MWAASVDWWVIVIVAGTWISLAGSEKVSHLRSHPPRRLDISGTTASVQTLNPYNYTCNREERLAGRCRWCNREYPNPRGIWTGFPPYWQQPGSCHNQAFDVADTQKCLTGRTIYTIGNSVARQAPFNLVEMLGGNPIKREDQRDQCPKHETTWDDSCHSEIAGVKLKYLFIQFLDGLYYHDRGGFPFFRYKVEGKPNTWQTGKIPSNTTILADGSTTVQYYNDPHALNADGESPIWMEDNCVNHDMRSCLEKFFHGSTERDILIFTAGMPYALDPWPGKEPKTSPGLDPTAWLRASAAAFREHISATFKGQVYRFTNAEFNSAGYVAPRTPLLKVVNDVLWEVWQPASTDRPWYTIDQWPINQNRHYLYNDHVHFNGPLTHAMLHQVLNELCPGGGKTTWSYPQNGQNITDAFRHHPPLIMVVQTSRFNSWYMVLLNGTRHNIPDMDTLAGLEIPGTQHVLVTNFDVNLFPEGEALAPCDPAWTSQLCKTSIYYKALHGLPY